MLVESVVVEVISYANPGELTMSIVVIIAAGDGHIGRAVALAGDSMAKTKSRAL